MSQLIQSNVKDNLQVNPTLQQQYKSNADHKHDLDLMELLKLLLEGADGLAHKFVTPPKANDDSMVDEFKDLINEIKTAVNDIKHLDVNDLLNELEKIKGTLSDIGNDIVGKLLPQAMSMVENLVRFIADAISGNVDKSKQDLDAIKSGLNSILKEILGKYDSGKVAAIINDVENSLENIAELGVDVYSIVEDVKTHNYLKLMKDIYSLSGNVTGILQDVEGLIHDITGKTVPPLVDIIAIAKDLRNAVTEVYDNLDELKTTAEDAVKIVEDLLEGKKAADMGADIAKMEADFVKLMPVVQAVGGDVMDIYEKVKDLIHHA